MVQEYALPWSGMCTPQLQVQSHTAIQNFSALVRFGVIAEVLVKIQVLFGLLPRHAEDEVTMVLKTLVTIYQTTRCNDKKGFKFLLH